MSWWSGLLPSMNGGTRDVASLCRSDDDGNDVVVGKFAVFGNGSS